MRNGLGRVTGGGDYSLDKRPLFESRRRVNRRVHTRSMDLSLSLSLPAASVNATPCVKRYRTGLTLN